jgi:hypothetical protein
MDRSNGGSARIRAEGRAELTALPNQLFLLHFDG